MPVPLDEFPVHQAPLSMAEVATSDRGFYDRCYLNAHDRSGDRFVVTGLGVYPNLGVADAYATLRTGDRLTTLRCSGPIFDDRLDQRVGPYRIEVLEPLRRLRVTLEDERLALDLTWEGSFACVDEPRHTLHAGPRLVLDGRRFAQVGTWSGHIAIGGEELAVTPDRWVGTRDRSWGIRPVGEPEPTGRPTDIEGFWWLYAPLRFEDFALVVIVQEDPDGTRTLNGATRVWADGRTEQLGWPHVELRYRPGSRHPEHATLHLTAPDRSPVTVEVDTLGLVPLHLGSGYGGDGGWGHGQWKGEGWVDVATHDLSDPDTAARVPWGVVDHVARATCAGAEGWGLFEHASLGRHDPTGMADWGAVAP